jgi:hypothetical protein
MEDGQCYELRFSPTEMTKQIEEIIKLQTILPNYHHYKIKYN